MTRIVHMSDSHGHHGEIQIPMGDIFIHSGDFSYHGNEKETMVFFEWFGNLPHTYKILVPGNHDFYCYLNQEEMKILSEHFEFIYLVDSYVVVEGFKVWGSPWIYGLPMYAFNKYHSRDLKEIWSKIPQDVEILITHSPPKGILDISQGKSFGDAYLRDAIFERSPILHLFGHIHPSNGVETLHGTCFVNSAVCDNYNNLVSTINVMDIIHGEVVCGAG